MASVFVTRRYPGDALDRIPAAGHTMDVWEEDRPVDRATLLERARDADALLCTLTDTVDGELLDACPRIRTVANFGVGYDNIDVAAAAARGVVVGNTPDVLTDATADTAFALLLAAARDLPGSIDVVKEGRWGAFEPGGHLGRDLAGATLGIVGAGRIGEAVARRAAGFDMQVITNTSRAGTPLPELLERSDFVSLHVPLNDATRHLIGAAELKRMKPTAILVNTARGPVVDTSALIDALHAGELGGAALDVTDPEPLPADHPLLAAPNVIVLPHIGSATTRTRARMTELAVGNVLAGLAGEPLPNPVAPPRS